MWMLQEVQRLLVLETAEKFGVIQLVTLDEVLDESVGDVGQFVGQGGFVGFGLGRIRFFSF